MNETPEAPRVRLAKDIDLSKAKDGCERCKGTGLRGTRKVETPDGDMEQTQKQLEDGSFSWQIAADIRTLPFENKLNAIRQLRERAADKSLSAQVRMALNAALVYVHVEPLQENVHDNA